MHTDNPYFPKNPIPPLDYNQNFPTASVLDGFVPPAIKNPMPFRNVNVQPSNACPRNFIIFDQTNNRSQIMFHPETNSKLFQNDDVVQNDENDHDKKSSPLEEEDYDDIDALLSTEYDEENEEVEDDEVSTARTGAYYECSSSDSCSNYETVPKKKRKLFGRSSGIRGGERKKRKKMSKMVKALRGIVPGATNRMSTVAVLDESVRYLKSLRGEVLKMGIKEFEG